MTSRTDDLRWLETVSPVTRKALYIDAERRVSGARLELYAPYPKQRAFHAAGATVRERALIAANQVGKTLCIGSEVAMHLTGRYPNWWDGWRFNRPVRWTAGSESAELTRKGVQRILLGPPELEAEWGTGTIPRDAIIFRDISRLQGVPDAVASIPVKHVTGGTSILQIASYLQGRTKWQADTLDGVWFDEEPPEAIYNEGKTRTNIGEGPVLMSLTPLFGMTTLMHRFLIERPAGTLAVNMTLEDAEHFTPEARERQIASYPEHERDARTKGIPIQGSGRIYPIDESALKIPAFPIPAHWPRIVGMDFGADHPTAAVWRAWDRDTDTVYVYDCYRASGGSLLIHAASIKARGAWIPVAWPHDGNNETAAGPALAKQYVAQAVAMRPTNAKFPLDPKNPKASRISVETGVTAIRTRMETGRFKVFSHLEDWFEEFRMYHRDNGLIVKKRDDLMDATRIGEMDQRFAIVAQVEAPRVQPVTIYDAEMNY